MPRDYGRLKQLLEAQEQFPLTFSFKVIGKNSPDFRDGITALQAQIPALRLISARESAEANHLSMTLELLAQTSDEIIWAFEQASAVPDARVLL